MWKDFFYYTKSQRRAIIALLMLIALLLVGIWVLPESSSSSLVKEESSKDSVALKRFEMEMQSRHFPRKKQSVPVVSEVQPELFPFDPNVADSMELSSLGLSKYVVRNVMKYRLKGGRFRTPESFARIYGMTEEQFNVLKPYIRIVQPDKPKPKKADTVIAVVVPERKVFKYPEGTLVDVNVADTAELKKIPGIGSGIAKAIVAYRNRLGGFYSLSQLEEIHYVTPELLKWFKLEGGTIRKLNINSLGLDGLRSHPYLNFYQAKVIIEHRRKRGEIKSLSQLSLYEEFTEKDLIRLSSYVSFD